MSPTLRRKLIRIGGSWALIIPPSMLRVVGVVEEVDLATDGSTITIRPVMPRKAANGDEE